MEGLTRLQTFPAIRMKYESTSNRTGTPFNLYLYFLSYQMHMDEEDKTIFLKTSFLSSDELI